MQPLHRNAPWYQIEDAFGVRLWDIEPRCQVAGIVDDQSVTLDGAVGASIQWDRMDQVAFFKRPTTARTFAKVALRTMPAYLFGGILMVSIVAATLSQMQSLSYNGVSLEGLGAGMQVTLAIGIVFLVPGAIIFLLAPYMIFELYRGEFWSTQAMFIGIEGVPSNLGWVERNIFGLNQGRLKWSVAGSTLSQHKLSTYDECEALPPKESTPALNPTNRNKTNYTNGEERPFTLIDTYTRTATVFYAVRPPTALIVCGQEGGMQRAVLCSYDWQRGTFSREAVVRVKTIVLERMFRVDRFRFALNRKIWEKNPESLHSKSETGSSDGQRRGFLEDQCDTD
ncbi:putative 3-hydroxyisobutyrate dehydrogenase protein [Daldinia childiae]|uniref:putative 3-hydroxyisobutyrate dehydrogenase protein n=1 Tax=Daldinia childiae TaxID=326645 RepID=UPI0014479F8B|nr:putative 3-hydroxyisobutyrate dehydrogenase protein [Daldinia childiae]KAF3058497.1 putative 3-hydroxyisobutyrate dehydrogenase protein [Daldinia childiae]